MPEKKTRNRSISPKQVQLRKQEILKRGSIPEFVQINENIELYQVYTEANLKNKLLV